MTFLAAGLLAALLSWAGNRTALKLAGTRSIVIISPLIEETAKTGSALILGGSVILTHGLFGLIEGIYDIRLAGTEGIKAGMVSLAGHLFYGLLTYWVLQNYGTVVAAVIGGYIAHMLWNLTVWKYVVQKKNSPLKGR